MKLSPHKPIDPKKFSFFYGWFLVPLATFGVIMSIPGQTAGFSAFTEPLLSVSKLSRTQLAFAYMLGTITSGFVLPIMGRKLDKWGSRLFMMFASLMLGLTLLAMSQVDIIVSKTSVFFPEISKTTLFIVAFILGIFCLRFFGQGLLPMAANTMIGKWFNHKRGRAIAITSASNSLAFAAAPAVMNILARVFGWKGAWLLLAILVGGGMTVLSWAFFRDTPEICGLTVDGEPEPRNTKTELNNDLDIVPGVTRETALKTAAFWAITLAVCFFGFVLTGFTFHIEALGVQAGLTPQKAVLVFVPGPFISIPLGFLAAWMSDRRITIRFLVIFMVAGGFLTSISLYFFRTQAGFVCAIIGIGVSSAFFGPLSTLAFPRYFGRKHLGSINGVFMSMTTITSALGPVFFSLANDLFGALRYAFIAAAVFPLILLPLIFKMEKPEDVLISPYCLT